MSKNKKQRYSAELKRRAVAQMQSCDNVVELGRRLGVPWRTLYRWKDQAAAGVEADTGAERAREEALLAENARLKAALAEKVLEVDFFKGALQKIEARRRGSNAAGGTASTTRCGR